MNKTEKYHKSIVKLAEIIKQRDNPLWIGAVTGEVVKAPPQLEVKLENGIIIKNHKIMISIEKIVGYQRTYSLKGNITKYDFDNTTSSDPVPQHPSHLIPKLQGSGKYKGSGVYQTHKDFWFTDTLQAGNEVLVEVVNNSYVVVAQIVRMPSGAKEGA